jgi:uncharacterized protein (TIGR03437 family)
MKLLITVCCAVAAIQAQVLPQGVRNILTYSTYLGGASDDSAHAVAVDPQGNVYVVGETVSADFPVTPGALQQLHAGVPGSFYDYLYYLSVPRPDAFIAKFDASGRLMYSTYLGGALDDIAYAVAADAQGNAYVAGVTYSSNFPVTTGAFQTTADFKTAVHSFVTKINPTGTALVYSTLIAGSGNDYINGLRIDSAGNAYIIGRTTSTDFPVTTGAFQTTAARGTGVNPNSHGFVAKLNPSGSQLVYATYLTGSSGASTQAMALNAAGEVFVAGATSSVDFPTTRGAWQTTRPQTSSGYSPGFLAHLNAAGSALASSTFLPIGPAALDIDASGAAYIAGTPPPTGFPITPGAFVSQTAYAIFVARLNPAASQLVFGASLGGDSFSNPNAIAVDTQGNVFVTGNTRASNFPITSNAYQTSFSSSMCFLPGIGPFAPGGDTPNCGDVFLTELDPTGAKLLYSTYFGSNGPDYVNAIALAPDGSVYIAGSTASGILPATANAVQTHRSFGSDCGFEYSPSAGGSEPCSDAFIAHFSPAAPAPVMPWEIVNAASFLPGAIAPGELVALVGPSIGPTQSATYQLDANGRVSTSLNGIRVLFNGVPAPLLYVGSNQINAVVPYDAYGHSAVPVHIETNGVVGFDRTIEVAEVNPNVIPVAPGIFAADASGLGQVAAFNQDGTVNGPAHPAPAGSVISFYATGLGPTNITVPDGTITDPSFLPQHNVTGIEVFIGVSTPLQSGAVAKPMWAGNAPYSVAGVSQVNVVIPPGTRSGKVPIYISIGHVVTSQSGMFITVQ